MENDSYQVTLGHHDWCRSLLSLLIIEGLLQDFIHNSYFIPVLNCCLEACSRSLQRGKSCLFFLLKQSTVSCFTSYNTTSLLLIA